MMATSTRTQLFRFLLVGGSTVLIDLLVYKVLLFWLEPSLAKGISFLCGTVYAYQFNRVWTFTAGDASLQQAVRFIGVYGTNLGVNVSVNALMLIMLPESFSFKINLAFLIATTVSALLNFLGMKFLVFQQTYPSQQLQQSLALESLITKPIADAVATSELDSTMKTLSLVIPCYNEARNLPLVLERFAQVIDRDDVEVIVVDNGSTDQTPEVLNELLPSYPFARTVRVEVNQGYGFGILSGLQAANARFLGWTHADMQTDPKDVLIGLELLENSLQPEQTYVKGERYGRPISDTFFTVGMSAFETLILGVPLWDINAQPNLFPSSFFAQWQDPPYDFSIEPYCYYLAVKQHLKVRRFQVRFSSRAHGVSRWNINWKSKIKFINRTIDFTWKLRQRLKGL